MFRTARVLTTAVVVVALATAGIAPAMADPPGVTDYSMGRATSASTTYSPEWQFTASRANDGDVSTGWSPLGTAIDPSPTWTLDLGTPRRLDHLDLVTRQDVDQAETRRNFEVRASNDPTFATYAVLASQGSSTLAYKATWTATVSNPNTYRYLRVAKTATEYFYIAEFRAFAAAAPAATQTAYVSATGSGTSCTSVSPCSLTGAQTWVRARTASMTGDIDVVLAGGTYQLASTFALTAADSGRNSFRVNWKAASGASVVFSGGAAVTGWTAVGDGSYTASVPSGTDFRQLYVNGVPAVRATDVSAGSFRTGITWNTSAGTITVPASTVASWANLNSVELVMNRHWQQARVRIQSIAVSGSSAVITPRTPEGPIFFGPTAAGGPGESFRFENAGEFVDQPGEFYLNPATNVVRYIPRSGENMATATVIRPVLDRLMSVEGAIGSDVHHITFTGIDFAYSTWLTPSSSGYITSQAGRYKLDPGNTTFGWLPGAVSVRYADNIEFDDTEWWGHGANALNLYQGSQQVRVVRSSFHDIAGEAIGVDAEPFANPADARDIVRDVVVKNNTITRTALDYTGSVAVFAGYPVNTYIDHNDISYTSYSGISIGFGSQTGSTQNRNNYIRYNEISHVVTLHDDGGAVYSQNPQPGSIWAENYIHDIARSSWTGGSIISGLYFDNLSGSITGRDNVFANLGTTVTKTLKQTCCGGTTSITLSNNDGSSATTIANAGPE